MSKRISVRDTSCSNYALVDNKDYERLVQYKWHVARRGVNTYARTSVDNTTGLFSAANEGTHKVYMHKMITGYDETDHKNNNGLDNRRENLREASRAQNNRNSRPRGGISQYKGVRFDKRRGHWYAQVRFNGKNRYLGRFDSEIEAAMAYDMFASDNYGEFARLNFP